MKLQSIHRNNQAKMTQNTVATICDLQSYARNAIPLETQYLGKIYILQTIWQVGYEF